MHWFVILLLIANLGLFIWGWSRDRSIDTPPPPLPQAPGQIRLLAEPDGPGGVAESKP